MLARIVMLLFALAARTRADNLACAGTGMDWYINMVGETPCQTYQKLRQICNSDYTVGVQSVNTPPDTCSDQVSTCCCNTIAFALSMLCLNCQQNIGTGTGVDAGVGAYQVYLNNGGTTSCANPQDHQLPTDIQTAVCNQQIKINDDIYTNGWADGAWFYILSRDTIIKDNIVASNNSFTHCASTTIHSSSALSSSSSSTSSSTASPTATLGLPPTGGDGGKKKLGAGAAAGIAIGAVALLGAATVGFWWTRRRQKRRQAGPLDAGGVFGDDGGEGRETAVVDEALVAHAYNYTSPTIGRYSDAPPSAQQGYTDAPGSPPTNGSYTHPTLGASSDYFGSASDASAGFGGLGAAGIGAAAYDAQSTRQTASDVQSTRQSAYDAQSMRGQGAGQSEASSGSMPNPYGGIAASASSGSARREAGPLPQKRRAGVPAPASPPLPTTGRAGSEEPFLEAEEAADHVPWLESESERHLDAGPVSDARLGRSPSGRLPPAYGEQM